MAQTTINNHTYQAAVILYFLVPVLMACLLHPGTTKLSVVGLPIYPMLRLNLQKSM